MIKKSENFKQENFRSGESTPSSQITFPEFDDNINKIDDLNKSSKPRRIIQLIAVAISFTAIGINDSATGSNLDSIQSRYELSYKDVSFLFLSNAGGYALSALCTIHILYFFGTRMTIFVSTLIYSGGSIMTAFAPPFPAVVIALFLLGVGSGFLDASSTSVLAVISSSNALTRIYACFSIGSMVAPFIIGAFSQHELQWSYFYFLPFAIGIILASTTLFIFNGFIMPNQTDKSAPVNKGIISVLKKKVAWLSLVLVLLTNSFQTTNSQWTPSYLLAKGYRGEVSKYIVAGFWGGVTVGRLLGPSAFMKLNEKVRNVSLVVSALAFVGILWGIDSLPAKAICTSFTGVCWGPLIPAAIDIGISRLPPDELPIITPFIIGSGLIGASISPFIYSFAAETYSPKILPGVLVTMGGIMMILFLLVPKKIQFEPHD